MKKSIDGKIVFNKRTEGGYYNMRIEVPWIAVKAVPGQFVTLKTNNNGMPLIRRPMGIFKIAPPFIEILYKKVGDGTELLSKKKPGELINVLGPLGNGFVVPAFAGNAILVGGGYGISPIASLYDKLKKEKVKTFVIIGAKSKSFVYKKGFAGAKVTTEDGSAGVKGLVTDVLEKLCPKVSCSTTVIYACGPVQMLKAVSKVAKKYNIECKVSMEAIMTCGVGVCLSCVCAVKAKEDFEYKRICADGPVFDAREFDW